MIDIIDHKWNFLTGDTNGVSMTASIDRYHWYRSIADYVYSMCVYIYIYWLWYRYRYTDRCMNRYTYTYTYNYI